LPSIAVQPFSINRNDSGLTPRLIQVEPPMDIKLVRQRVNKGKIHLNVLS